MSLKEGTCPKCSSKEIYTNKKCNPRGERGQIVISGWKWMWIDLYLCMDCGFFEEYVNEEDFREEKNREKIKTTWGKV
ncbi:MAG: hypothetical protein KBG21_01760 [Ignavibacteria bacterium]|nr:hypothetical protein [Ignavibacteria bacterium]